MNKQRKFLRSIGSVGCLLGIFLLLFSLQGCKRKPKDNWDDTIKSGIINIACDDNFRVMMDAQIQVFEGLSDYQTVVTPIYTNEKEAIRLLVADSVRFALATRDLNPSERKEVEESGRLAKKFLVAFDGIALVVNRQNKDTLLTIADLKKILTGEITEWSQINENTRIGTIRVLFDNKESGILRYVVDSIARGEALSPNLYALNNDKEVLEKVVEMPNAIGLVGLNVLADVTLPAYRKLRSEVSLVRISRDEHATLENSYLPYPGDINQENYPLWRPVYSLLTDPRMGLSSGLSVFLSNERGQKIILQSGLLPVTDPQVLSIQVLDGYPGDKTKTKTKKEQQ